MGGAPYKPAKDGDGRSFTHILPQTSMYVSIAHKFAEMLDER